MGQVNVAITDELERNLDRVAEAKGVKRTDLLRQTIAELIEAFDAGRGLFQSEAAPKLDASVNGLVHQLRELVIELDRAQAENARLFGKLIDSWNGGEEANRIAQKKMVAQFREHDAQALSPFYEKASALLAAFEALEPAIVAALEPRLSVITEQLDKAIELASEPRQMRAIYLGDNRMLSLRFLSACGALVLTGGVLLGLFLPALSESWSLWQARKLIDHPSQVCRLIDAEYGRDDCRLPERERELGLRVVAHEDRR